MKNIENYDISDDYERLYDLIVSGYEIVGFIQNHKELTLCEITCRDINGTLIIDVRSYNKHYIDLFTKKDVSIKDDFIDQCEKQGVKYIVPDKI